MGYAKDFWQAQGVSEDTLSAHLPMTRSSLAKLLSAPALQPSRGVRHIPTSFEADDPDLRALPRAAAYEWRTLASFLKDSGATGLIVRLPLFWQTIFAAQSACRTVGIPYLSNDPENIPVATAALRLAGVDTVLTELKDAHDLWSYCEEKRSVQPAAWIIVHRADAQSWMMPHSIAHAAAHLLQEVHVVPGAPILEQCSHLAAGKRELFHRTEGYEWRIDSGKTFITATVSDNPPLVEFQCDWHVFETGACVCGRATYSRI